MNGTTHHGIIVHDTDDLTVVAFEAKPTFRHRCPQGSSPMLDPLDKFTVRSLLAAPHIDMQRKVRGPFRPIWPVEKYMMSIEFWSRWEVRVGRLEVHCSLHVRMFTATIDTGTPFIYADRRHVVDGGSSRLFEKAVAEQATCRRCRIRVCFRFTQVTLTGPLTLHGTQRRRDRW